MKLKRFTVNPISVNCYVLSDDNGEGVIIDSGAFEDTERERIDEYVVSEGIHLRYALQTHMHFDHILSLPYIYNRYLLKPCFHEADQTIYDHYEKTAEWCGLPLQKVRMPEAEMYLTDGQTIEVGTLKIKVLHTPGHTPGGVCYYIANEGILFSGDTLFYGSVGRTDFPGGNMLEEIQSVKEKLFQLPNDTTVFPGHGGRTNIGREKENNPYL